MIPERASCEPDGRAPRGESIEKAHEHVTNFL